MFRFTRKLSFHKLWKGHAARQRLVPSDQPLRLKFVKRVCNELQICTRLFADSILMKLNLEQHLARNRFCQAGANVEPLHPSIAKRVEGVSMRNDPSGPERPQARSLREAGNDNDPRIA